MFTSSVDLSNAGIEKILDTMYVIQLLKERKWEEASKFGDHVTYGAITTNEQWIWDQLREMTNLNQSEINSVGYGNIAMAIHYGAKFPERKEEIERLKTILARDL